jgi:hypothetical protein
MRAVKGNLGRSPEERHWELDGIARANGTLQETIAKQSEDRVGEKYLPLGGRVR